jgi:nitrogen fixation-related uncharacterized protein
MDLIILAVLAAVVLFGLAAHLWGVDSRPSFVDPRVADTWAS